MIFTRHIAIKLFTKFWGILNLQLCAKIEFYILEISDKKQAQNRKTWENILAQWHIEIKFWSILNYKILNFQLCAKIKFYILEISDEKQGQNKSKTLRNILAQCVMNKKSRHKTPVFSWLNLTNFFTTLVICSRKCAE